MSEERIISFRPYLILRFSLQLGWKLLEAIRDVTTDELIVQDDVHADVRAQRPVGFLLLSVHMSR